jgi:SSS family solute:Na+ symporter
LFFTIGTALWIYYRQQPAQLDLTLDTDAVFPLFIVHVMPAGVAGLVIAGIFAAAQSTVSGSLNSVATAVVTDFVRPARPTLTDRAALSAARWITGGIGALATFGALLLASYNVLSLWDTYNTLVGLASSGLAGLFLLGIGTRRAHGRGALVGVAASALALGWVQTRTDVHFFLYAAIGILTCVAVGYISSLLIPAPAQELTGLTLFTRKGRTP